MIWMHMNNTKMITVNMMKQQQTMPPNNVNIVKDSSLDIHKQYFLPWLDSLTHGCTQSTEAEEMAEFIRALHNPQSSWANGAYNLFDRLKGKGLWLFMMVFTVKALNSKYFDSNTLNMFDMFFGFGKRCDMLWLCFKLVQVESKSSRLSSMVDVGKDGVDVGICDVRIWEQIWWNGVQADFLSCHTRFPLEKQNAWFLKFTFYMIISKHDSNIWINIAYIVGSIKGRRSSGLIAVACFLKVPKKTSHSIADEIVQHVLFK